MNLLVPLAALLGFELQTLKDKVQRTLVGNAVMLVLALIGGAFLLAAGFLALAARIGPMYAALSFAGVFLLAALVVFLAMRYGAARERRYAAEKRHSGEAGAMMTTAALTALPVVLRSPVLRTVGLPVAAVAAFLLLRNRKND